MTNQSPNPATPAAGTAAQATVHSTPLGPVAVDANRAAMFKDIHSKWTKFSESDVTAFKNKDELVTGIVSKYGQDKAIVQREVDTLLKGRMI